MSVHLFCGSNVSLCVYMACSGGREIDGIRLDAKLPNYTATSDRKTTIVLRDSDSGTYEQKQCNTS
jgi:hypothetical protein